MNLLSVQVEIFNPLCPDSFAINERFYRRTSTAHFSLMSPAHGYNSGANHPDLSALEMYQKCGFNRRNPDIG